MIRHFQCALALIGLMTLNQSIAADSNDTNAGGITLSTLCNQTNHDQNNLAWTTCITYVTGVADGFDRAIATLAIDSGAKELKPEDAEAMKNSAELLFHVTCRPIGSTPEQTALVVSKYLADNPKYLNLTAAALIMNALADAWPCPKKSGG